MEKINVPSKSERDDGGDKPIGFLGLLFGVIVFGVFVYVCVNAVLGG